MDQRLYEALQRNPIIAAVRDDGGLEACLREDVQVVFVLYGDLCSIAGIIGRIKAAGKLAIVHADLISGLSVKEISVDFLHRNTQADGIISTRANLIQRAKELQMMTILRVFLIDSMAYESIFKTMRAGKPDCIEILPALMPKVIQKLCKSSPIPVIAGGMVSEKEDIMALLQAGAVSVSSTNQDTWFI